VIVWKHVSCPYILKFNGVFYRNEVPVIVSPWVPNGNITEYLETHPDANRFRLVSLNVPLRHLLHNLTPYRFSLCVWRKDSDTFTIAKSHTGISKL
jgi:serine/threonine protein kinase